MRAIKLITVSTVAVLMGGTSLAIGQQGAGFPQSGSSFRGGGTISEEGTRGSETRGSNPRAAENPMRRSEASAERGSNIQGSRDLQRGQGMRTERGRAIAGERGLAMSSERGRGTNAPEQFQGQLGSQPRQSFGRAYGRASEREMGAGLTAQQRERIREIVSDRRDLPRVSNLPDVRVNAVIPRSVRLAAIPEEVVRIYPRFRRHQAFIYRNEIVVVDPVTSRIVAVLPA
jgi:hypothetical protein